MSDEPLLEAKTFRTWGSIDGIQVNIVIRAFVEDGKVLAIRSARVLDAGGNAYPTVTDGKMSAADLAAMSKAKP